MIAVDSLRQQRGVQKRIADKSVWREHFASKKPPEKPEWPKGADARNHKYWKWMELRARMHEVLAEIAWQNSNRQRQEWVRLAVEAADTHPWAHRADIREAWGKLKSFDWRAKSIWRTIVFACWNETRPGMTAWPAWMRQQRAGQKSKARARPRVEPPCDGMHPQGRNRRLREVFEGLESRAEQRIAVEVMTVATGSAPDWMIPREIDPPKRRGRPKKAA